jgi:hypothetical protein
LEQDSVRHAGAEKPDFVESLAGLIQLVRLGQESTALLSRDAGMPTWDGSVILGA